MSYKIKYAIQPKYARKGPTPRESMWGTERAAMQTDKRYAWMKHRAQAKYRGESHSITLDEWLALWTDELWMQRGKGVDSMCLSMCDLSLGWHCDNVRIVSRREHLKAIKTGVRPGVTKQGNIYE